MTLLEPGRQRVAPAFADDLARHGDRVALVADTGSLTYAELEREVATMADRLGTERRLVLLGIDRSIRSVVAYLAALRGGHPVLLAPARDAATLQTLADAYDPDVVLDGADGSLVERRATSAHELHPDLALLLSTSGSTASPKQVRLSRANVESNAAAIAELLGLTPDDRAVTTLPPHYCYGLSVINSHLHAGAALVLTGLSVVGACFWDLVERTAPTSFAGVPHTFELLDRVGFPSMSVPSLRYLTQAGGRMDPETVRRYAELGAGAGWDLVVMYGQTEATARMAYLPPAMAATRPSSVGVAIPGGQLTIADPDADGVGELVFRGPNVMLGYARHPEDLALGATVDALHTGDLARMGDDGLCEIVGRRSRLIKPFGLRIDLDGVERLLAEDGVASMCAGDDHGLVVGVERDDQVERAALVVTRQLGLPRSHVSVVAGELPRLASGKPHHAAFLQRIAEQPPETPPRHASGSVADVFAEVLGVTPAQTDTFVELGGDSLSYVEMSIALEDVLGTLPPTWHTTTVGELAMLRRPRRRLASTDTSAVVRAVSIVLIVATHVGLWQLPGGAHALVAVAGLNFARFQLRTRSTAAGIARIAVPSMCWIGLVAAMSAKYGWPNALLVHGFVERAGDKWGYWFIEALVWILLPLAALMRVPAVAQAERTWPFAVPLAAVGLGLLFRFDVVGLTTTQRTSRPHEVLFLFALGWAAARARSWPQRAVVSAVAALSVHGFFGNADRELVVLVGILLITWVPTLPVPRPAHRLVAPLAGASLYIYLTHFQLYPLLDRAGGHVVAVVGSLVGGIVAWLVARRIVADGERVIRRIAARPVARQR